MKKLMVGLVACCAAIQVVAAEPEWLTDLPKAKAKAKAEKKLVLMDFTGSDWCPPCKALKKNVLSSQEFAEYAAKHFVLVELDFPRAKEQSDELKKANQELQAKFEIRGYPTIIVVNSDGKELWREVGYSGVEPKAYVQKLETVKAE